MPKKYYETREVIDGYMQSYRCGCTCPPGKVWAKGWVSVLSEREDDRQWEGKQHFQFERNGQSCLRFLKYASTEARLVNKKSELPYESDAWGRRCLRDQAQTSTAAKVVAVMWCSQKKKWHTGASGTGVNASMMNDHAPRAISSAIGAPDVDLADDAYGWNCAEVACVLAAYKAGRGASNLEGCRFFASRTSGGGELSACKTCRVWIKKLKGSYGAWEGGKYIGLV